MKEKNNSKADPWLTKPDVIRKFLDLLPKYEDLCREIEYILSKRIKQAGIEVSTATYRAKTLNSFLEKLERKSYQDPFDEITDIAGVRVVCLYASDIDLIEKIVSNEFEIVEKVDKLTEKEPDQFGYGAIHYIIRLGKKSSGARYDDLKELLCEVQVRTVLQDAWAIIDHHLVYKNEPAVPQTLRRKLNSLAGLFETADDQFQQIRGQRQTYVDKVRELVNEPKQFFKTKINLDSLREYLQWRFPDQPVEAFDGQHGLNLEALQKAGYQNLADLENELNEDLIKLALDALNEMSRVAKKDDKFSASVILICSLSLGNKKLLDAMNISDEQREITKKYSKVAA